MKPEVVRRVVQEIPDTENVAVYEDLTDAALNMPPEVAALLVEKAKTWACSPYQVLLPEKLGALVAHLARGGKVDEALDLARVLLEILPDPRAGEILQEGPYHLLEPRARFDTWEYEQILNRYFPDLARAAGVQALELLCDLLDEAIRLSMGPGEKEGSDDLSWSWRPAVEDHPQNLPSYSDVRGILVSAVRDTAEFLVESTEVTLSEVVQLLEERPWKVFHRIALHLLRHFAGQAPDLVARRLTNKVLFDDPHMRHEYALLLKVRFAQLESEEQQVILGWIEAGPDLQGYGEQDRERYRDLWQRDRLAWIGPALPAEWRQRYQALVETHGEPEHPEFLGYTETRVGWASPKSAQELHAMSIEAIIKFLQTWIPPESPFEGPSPEGLGRALSAVVSEDPQRFAEKAEKFKGLDPTYVRALLSGLHEGLKQGRPFDWCPVLDLCRWVINQPREIPGRKIRPLDADPDWGRTRKQMVRLLSTGLQQDSLPMGLRVAAWGILEPLTCDPDPTPHDEALHVSHGMDPVTLSINTTRGEALHTVMQYALWLRRYIEKQADAAKSLDRGFDEMPEVRRVLEAHLDLSCDPSLAIRSVYGRWFPWLVLLDSEWAASRVAQVFPLDESKRTYFDAAWDAYVIHSRPYLRVLDLLRNQYEIAVERIGEARDRGMMVADPDRRLSEHLMELYWLGKIELDDPLLQRFWEKASSDLRAHALRFVGAALGRTEDQAPEQTLTRLKLLWESRLRAARETTNVEQHRGEMSAFGWWFLSRKFSPDWAITQLGEVLKISGQVAQSHRVVEYLAEIAEQFPGQAVQCLEAMIKGDQKGWGISMWREQAQVILRIALQRPETRAQAEDLIHYLGSRGYLEFRDLLR